MLICSPFFSHFLVCSSAPQSVSSIFTDFLLLEGSSVCPCQVSSKRPLIPLSKYAWEVKVLPSGRRKTNGCSMHTHPSAASLLNTTQELCQQLLHSEISSPLSIQKAAQTIRSCPFPFLSPPSDEKLLQSRDEEVDKP